MPTPPVHHVAFDEFGQFVDRPGFDALLAEAADAPTDVFLLSHGWNNSSADASQLYAGLLGQMTTVADAVPDLRPPGYLPLAVGVIWPSKAWDEEADSNEGLNEAVYESLSPARASPAGFRHDVLRVAQLVTADRLAGRDLEEFRSLLRRHAEPPAEADDRGRFDPNASDEALEGLGSSARDVFRAFTYWQMKKRAGVVGAIGVRVAAVALQARFPNARLHLVGHSFGCKVMLAAVAGPGEPLPKPVQTLVLLQGAVSYEAMAETVSGTTSPGGYRDAVDVARVAGPIVASFSRLDKACGQAYPLASRVANQTGELEGLLDRFRALGAVGASGVRDDLDRGSPAMLDVGTAYGFTGTGVWSVDGGTGASAFITGHSVIQTPQVAWLIWSAVRRR